MYLFMVLANTIIKSFRIYKEKSLNELVKEIDFIPYQYKHGESM